LRYGRSYHRKKSESFNLVCNSSKASAVFLINLKLLNNALFLLPNTKLLHW
jgi:hypothetical protein